MSKNIQLDLLVRSSREGDRWEIADLPSGLWEQFVTRAAELMPEKAPDQAWASFLCEAIASVCSGDTATHIMTDIPREAADRLQAACGEARIHSDAMYAALLHAAQGKRFHIVKFSGLEKGDDVHALVLLGISDPAWVEWSRIAAGAKVSAEELFGRMIEAAHTGSLTLTPETDDVETSKPQEPRTKNQESTPNGTKGARVAADKAPAGANAAGSSKRRAV